MIAADCASTVIVVPCFNEAHRFREAPFLELAAKGDLFLLMVNDGSVDDTADLVRQLASKSTSIGVLDLERNVGKAEAVRRGFLTAIAEGATFVGYYDADASTPPGEMLSLVDLLMNDQTLIGVFGSRVARLGSVIERSVTRHYLGRAYATAASLALGMTVYDTQCGAKMFRVVPSLVGAVADPFPSPWTLDVWLLQRLICGTPTGRPVPRSAFIEVPLGKWRDVGGSRMTPVGGAAAFVDLARVAACRLGWGSRSVP